MLNHVYVSRHPDSDLQTYLTQLFRAPLPNSQERQLMGPDECWFQSWSNEVESGKGWIQEVALASPFWNPQQHVCQLLCLFIITSSWIRACGHGMWSVCMEHLPHVYQACYSILRIQKKKKTWSLSSCTHGAVGRTGINRSLWYRTMWALTEVYRELWEAYRAPIWKPFLTLQRFSGFDQTLVIGGTMPYSASVTFKHKDMSHTQD